MLRLDKLCDGGGRGSGVCYQCGTPNRKWLFSDKLTFTTVMVSWYVKGKKAYRVMLHSWIRLLSFHSEFKYGTPNSNFPVENLWTQRWHCKETVVKTCVFVTHVSVYVHSHPGHGILKPLFHLYLLRTIRHGSLRLDWIRLIFHYNWEPTNVHGFHDNNASKCPVKYNTI